MAGKKKGGGSRLVQIGLDQDLVDRFTDFREGGFQGSPEYRMLAAAIEHYMDFVFEHEPAVKKRTEDWRKKRLGLGGEKIRVLPTTGK